MEDSASLIFEIVGYGTLPAMPEKYRCIVSRVRSRRDNRENLGSRYFEITRLVRILRAARKQR